MSDETIQTPKRLRELLVGRTIVVADQEPERGGFTHGNRDVTLTLDNGATVSFMGVGYDASETVTTYTPAVETAHESVKKP